MCYSKLSDKTFLLNSPSHEISLMYFKSCAKVLVFIQLCKDYLKKLNISAVFLHDKEIFATFANKIEG